MFFTALWHALKVVSAGLFWLIEIGLIWAGFALMGGQSQWGGADLFVAIGLFVARGLITPRFVPGGASYVIVFAAQLVYFGIAIVLTGYSGA